MGVLLTLIIVFVINCICFSIPRDVRERTVFCVCVHWVSGQSDVQEGSSLVRSPHTSYSQFVITGPA